ncbi:MAG: hypothetical protein FJW36_22085 [Acidobacteria bacterium]|nr:hypothetical protein [Acidobacteriota bacterium]
MTKPLAAGLFLVLLSVSVLLLLGGSWLSGTPGGMRIAAVKFSGGSMLDAAGVEFQKRQNDCGPACLRMVARTYGIDLPLDPESEDLKRSLGDLARTCKQAGLRARAWRLRAEDLGKA